MNFLNFGIGELLGLVGAVSAGVVALYLLDRSKRHQLVATLQFWTAADVRTQLKRRRRIQQPWSLLLQLLSLALLLTAIAGPQLGVFDTAAADHVIVLDTSAWMGSITPQQGVLLDQAKTSALAYLDALSSRDRVMLIRADALATPATPFETDRAAVRNAIQASQAGASQLNLGEALAFAERVQRRQSAKAGEIAYIGAARVSEQEADFTATPSNLRVITVGTPSENVGIRELAMRRSPTVADAWDIFVAVRNYGTRPQAVDLAVQYAQSPAGSKRLALRPGTEEQVTFTYREKVGGWVEARLNARDAFPQDDRAIVELPAQANVKVRVYTNDAATLRPLFASNPLIETEFVSASAFDPAAKADIVVLDRFAPLQAPQSHAIWIEPPNTGRSVSNTPLERWNTSSTLGAGLYTRDVVLTEAQVLTPTAGDIVVAESAAGPVITARDGSAASSGAYKQVWLGFNPARSAMKYELASPLLMANIVRWMTPGTFRRYELRAGATGTISVPVEEDTDASMVKVTDQDNAALPFTLDDGNLQFFAGTPGTVRAIVGAPGSEREMVYSLTLPDVAEALWKPPAGVRKGVPKASAASFATTDLWPWLAALGGLGLLADWWFFARSRRAVYRLALLGASIAAIVLALFRPTHTLDETRVAVSLLADTSASASEADIQRADELATAIADEQGRHALKVIPFARVTSSAPEGPLAAASGEEARATDLESAVLEGIAALPSGVVPRLALISDGKENKGSIVRAAWQARDLGIPIDTFALKGRAKPALRLDSVSLPSVAFTGEQFPIDLVVSAPRDTAALIDLAAEGHSIGQSTVTLKTGQNPLRLHTSLNTPGALELSVIVRSEGSELRFDQSLNVRRPRVLYFSNDLPAEDQHIVSTLTGAQFDVVRAEAVTGVRLQNYQLVVFNNWDIEGMADGPKADVENYVRQGGGLLIIGGDRNVYNEANAQKDDPLRRAMPATIAPPRSPEGSGVVLIIDKSSSMEGRKMDIARRAAIGVIDNLRPIDLVGVLAFDNSWEWAVPIRKTEDGSLIKRIISGITPDGGTQIPPALEEAYKKITPIQAAVKHVLLLTDGISEEGNSLTTAKNALAGKITISTVGLGQDVNRSYLEKVAAAATGKSYFVTDFDQLEQILIRDVLEHTGQTTVERPLPAQIVRQAEILNGVEIAGAPVLKGYVRYEAKPTAETILKIDAEDPLLARWQYGLGRAAVFTSDAKARWAADWVAWKSFDTFWTNVARDLLPHTQGGEATVTYDSANSDLVVNYRLGRGVPEPSNIPPIFVFGPGGFQAPIPVRKIAAGAFEGRLPIGERQGLFRVRPVEDSLAFPETGLYRPEDELADYGNNEALLKQVAEFTGGRFEPKPEEVFTASGRSILTTMHLWPWLLGLAVLFSLAELVLRKWKGVISSLA